MQQINLDIDDDLTSSIALTPKQIQTLIRLMEDAIIAVLESDPGETNESE
ncbi:MAG: hypothetical protein ACE5FQ_15180 [Thiogranum sp.]